MNVSELKISICHKNKVEGGSPKINDALTPEWLMGQWIFKLTLHHLRQFISGEEKVELEIGKTGTTEISKIDQIERVQLAARCDEEIDMESW